MAIIELENTRGAPLRFSGELLAQVDSSRDSRDDRQRDRWSVYRLYRLDTTPGHVLASEGHSVFPHEQVLYDVDLLSTADKRIVAEWVKGVILRKHRGGGRWMAGLLIRRAFGTVEVE